MAADDPQFSGRGLERLEYESLLPLYEDALSSDPDDFAALYWLGHAYTSLGRIEEGLDVDLRLSASRPADPTVRYNLACSFALSGRVEDALAALRTAVDLGYRDLDHLLSDPDLASLREEPGFRGVVERLAED